MNERILSYLKQLPNQRATIDDLREALGVSSSQEITTFMKTWNKLLDEAVLIEVEPGVVAPIEATNHLIGQLDRKPRGFGFVVPSDPRQNDVFVPGEAMNDAMNNDIVLVALSPFSRASRPEGRIVRVLTRNYTHIIGTVMVQRKRAVIVPDDQTVKQTVIVALSELHGATEGDKVHARIKNYSNQGRIECTVERVLGNINDPGVDVLSKILKYNIDPLFSDDVLTAAEEARDYAEQPSEDRHDLRDLPYVTIDGDDAKDFDDAVFVELTKDGHTRLGVSIADVSHFVKEQSVLDQEAYRRGTSIYLADRVIPMLPEVLSNDLCSLRPNEDRYTLTCEMVIDADGKVLDYDIYPSIIRSRHRMTYDKVNRIFQGDEQLANDYVDVVGMFHQMRTLAKTLKKARTRKGSVLFDTKESVFTLDEHGRAIDVQARKMGISESIIEEFMLLANKVVAEHVHWMELPFLYRIHEQPTEEKLRRLIQMANALGFRVKGSTEVSHHELQKLLDAVEGTEAEDGINLLMLRSMQKAIYSETNLGHYGLAFDFYTHFTSPIRRYPDLIVHRLLRRYLFEGDTTKDTIEHYRNQMNAIANQSSKTEQNAVHLEREVADMKKAEYISRFLRKTFEGHISSVTSFGLYVALPNTVEGLVHISTLQDDYYHYSDHLMMLVGERTGKMYKVGDHVTIRVTGANVIDGDVDFELVKRRDADETDRPE
jgi:ribonuclease R